MGFARNLRRLRKQAQLSQSQLADKTGLSLRTIRMWERGDAAPGSNALLVELARALGVAVADLLAPSGLRGPKKPPRH
jgi:transcriptional regulator with XRE-family HTH domain